MKRRYWCGTIVTGLTWLGSQGLPAQAPASRPAPVPVAVPATTSSAAGVPKEGDLLTFRTAGQPERRVRVIRISGTIDDGLADVQDLSSNAKYSIPLRVLSSMAKTATTTAPGSVPAIVPKTPPLVVTPNPSAAPLTRPNVPPRNDARMALPSPTAARALMNDTKQVAYSAPTPPPAPAVPPPHQLPALPIPQAPPNPADAPPTTPMPPAAPTSTDDVFFRPAGLPTVVPQPDAAQAPPEAWSKPTPIAAPPAAPMVVAAPPVPTGIGLPPTQPAFSTVKPPVVNINAPEYIPVPVYDYSGAPAKAVAQPTPQAAPVTPVPMVAPVPTPIVAQQPLPAAVPQAIVQTSLSLSSSASAQPELITADVLARMPAQMAEELQPYLIDLSRALRPSLRQRAASGLADGRYGSRPEVKAVLARAALLDPAPAVKAHCIHLLSKLGYHESSYLDYLDSCAESAEATVKQAAVDAVAKLRTK